MGSGEGGVTGSEEGVVGGLGADALDPLCNVAAIREAPLVGEALLVAGAPPPATLGRRVAR